MNPRSARKQIQTFNTTVLVTMLFGGILLTSFSIWWLVAFHLIAGATAYGIWFGRYQLLNPTKWTLAHTATLTGFVTLGFVSLAMITFED